MEHSITINFGSPLPLFPLDRCVLLPHVTVPLRVFDPRYLAMEPTDPENIFFVTGLTLLAILGFILAWRSKPFEAIRYGGVLFIYPAMFYFIHPEAYRMRPLDPLFVILGCYAIFTLREWVVERKHSAIASEAASIQQKV